MALIDEIKAKYPRPRAMVGGKVGENPPADGDYCVGGAVCLYQCDMSALPASKSLHFPLFSTLAKTLRILNSALPFELAYEYARLIIVASDAEDFPHAWHITQQALEYVPRQDGDDFTNNPFSRPNLSYSSGF